MSLEEELVHFIFTLTRGASPQQTYRSLLERIFFQSEHHPNIENLKAVSIALVAHTRDTVGGKGEYSLFYQLLEVLILMGDDDPRFVPIYKELLTKSVLPTDNYRPYGSWKDVKYLLNHLRNVYGAAQLVTKPVFEFIVQLLAQQLIVDSKVDGDGHITLAGKWAPREKSAFGWQAQHVAAACFPNLKPHTGCRAYRKMISALNRRLKTTQVLQCGQRWSEIDFEKGVTSRTLFCQRDAFVRGSQIDKDRRKCRSNFIQHLSKSGRLSSKHVTAGEVVRAHFNSRCVDAFWHVRVSPLGLVIPFLDTSASVAGETKEALYSSIGIGLQLAERSAFGRRLFAFSSTVSWVTLDHATKLSEMVPRVPCEELGSNLERAIRVFLGEICACGIEPVSVADYTLVIISDMNFDNDYNHSNLKAQFDAANVPLPYIVYWNIDAKKHRRLDVDITDTKVTFISGFQENAINQITKKKKQDGDYANTAWNKLVNMLCVPRYSWVWCVL